MKTLLRHSNAELDFLITYLKSLSLLYVKKKTLFKVHSNLIRLIRDWGKGEVGTYIVPKNDHQNDKTLGRTLWHRVFNVSTVVRNKVTKTVP